MEVYIDDMIVKSKQGNDHGRGLEETLEILGHYTMNQPQEIMFEIGSNFF